MKMDDKILIAKILILHRKKLSSDPKLVPYILLLIEGGSILDIGCGQGKWGYLLRTDYWYTKSGRSARILKICEGVIQRRCHLRA